MNANHLSIIVITYNRWDKLLNCLMCLEKQTVSGFEVIVVNDGSTDDTAARLNKYTASNFSLSVIHKPNEGRSFSRNRGAHESKGTVLVFFDDDMKPEPGCVAAHLSLIEKHDNVISVGTQDEDLSQAHTDFDQFRHHMTKIWERRLEQSQDSLHPYLTSANFSILKKSFELLHGFDRNMETVEDFELGYRATQTGFLLVYNPLARAWHDNACDCSTYIRKQIEYHRAYMIVAAKHQQLTGKVGLYNPGFLKRLIFNLMSRRFFVQRIDNEFFKNKLPAFIRYKMYDVIITGVTKVYPERYRA